MAKQLKADPKGTAGPVSSAMSHWQARRRVDNASAGMVPASLERAVEYAHWFRREVETGLAQVDARQTLVHEAVRTRLEEARRP